MSVRSPSGASGAATALDALADRQALAGQRRLGDLQRRRGEHAPVGGHDVAGLDLDDVAGHELLGRQLRERAVAAHARLDDHHLRQRRHGRRRLALLVEAEHGVEQRQQQDHDPGARLLDRVDRDHAGDQQHDLHRVLVLAQERVPARLRLRLGELVRPVARQALGRLVARQARARARRRSSRSRVLAREHVPGRRLGRRRSRPVRWSPSRSSLSPCGRRSATATRVPASPRSSACVSCDRADRGEAAGAARRTSTRRGPSAPSSPRRTRGAPSSSGVALRIARWSGVPQSA